MRPARRCQHSAWHTAGAQRPPGSAPGYRPASLDPEHLHSRPGSAIEARCKGAKQDKVVIKD